VLGKGNVFAAGGRPVIYLPDGEGEWIPEEDRWRHVRFERGQVDLTHEREWRVPDELDLKKVNGLYVLVWTPTEAREIANLKTPLDQKILGALAEQRARDYFRALKAGQLKVLRE
jgi:hypothetical protein